ncbi:MAG TPA: alpha/beta hydrolase-fold protein [Acidobacteriaceae bacterium]|nr:alpha/beta hydrolase-fold protein [Acidobacteriaceae bacterium]
MIPKRYARSFPLPCLLLAASLAATQTTATPHLFFRVTLGTGMARVASGRVLIFLEAGSGAKQVRANEFHPSATSIAAEEVTDLHPGESIDVDVDQIAFPAPFSSLKPGTYEAQAVLDVDHTYAYDGLQPGDLESDVAALPNWTPGRGSEPAFVLDRAAPARRTPNLKMSPEVLAAAKPSMHLADFVSAALTAFWGRPIHMRAWVVLPPGYADHPHEHYPAVYWTHGFGATLPYDRSFGAAMYERMAEKKMPPMIWVMLDESLPTGTHEFDNSVNNGPWGTALVEEFIPWIETQYRMDAKASGRFLNGHSSGGWATLQLQIDYPRVFGGTWSTSPDPSDFHNFTGPDLYAPHANVYYERNGSLYPLVRDHGHVIATFKEFAQQEAVLGSYGGQMASFEWVFSPRGPDGRPVEMFDRKTGDVNPAVVAYWREHYDLAHIAKTTWPEQGRYLKGKIHLIVGTADTFYLNESARLLQQVLQGLGADAHFTFRPDRTHFDLYAEHGDRMALMDEITAQMYAVARPKAHWQAPASEDVLARQ